MAIAIAVVAGPGLPFSLMAPLGLR